MLPSNAQRQETQIVVCYLLSSSSSSGSISCLDSEQECVCTPNSSTPPQVCIARHKMDWSKEGGKQGMDKHMCYLTSETRWRHYPPHHVFNTSEKHLSGENSSISWCCSSDAFCPEKTNKSALTQSLKVLTGRGKCGQKLSVNKSRDGEIRWLQWYKR